MAQDCPGSVQVCRMRVALLDASGAPDAGAGNLYVTDTLIRLQADPQVEEGQDFSLINGCGDNVVPFTDDDRISRMNLTMQLAKPDPGLTVMLCGGEVFTQGGDVTGFKYPPLNTPLFTQAVSIEAWSKAIVNGQLDDELPYMRWVLPLTRWRPAGRTWENAAMVTELVGRAFENDSWGNGPANDWDQDSDAVIQQDRDEDIPDALCGVQELAAS